MEDIPLGKASAYPANYAPEVLYAIPRANSREPLGIGRNYLPFGGADIWTAWELTWLGRHGKPDMAAAEIRVPVDSPNLVESKSLKLYLNSFAMLRIGADELVDLVAEDLGSAAGAPVDVSLLKQADIATLPGESLDALDVTCEEYSVDPGLLSADPKAPTAATLRTGLLRSLCPVTSQPDFGSVMIRYEGPRIDPASLLRYIVSFREHRDFHEACVERMFQDIKAYCHSDRLTVYARYQRRGGLDINPFRSDFEDAPDNGRLWNQ